MKNTNGHHEIDRVRYVFHATEVAWRFRAIVGRFLPVMAVRDFSAWQNVMLGATAEFGPGCVKTKGRTSGPREPGCDWF